jgi:hypothetical protein
MVTLGLLLKELATYPSVGSYVGYRSRSALASTGPEPMEYLSPGDDWFDINLDVLIKTQK